jgi:hypothetical protein
MSETVDRVVSSAEGDTPADGDSNETASQSHVDTEHETTVRDGVTKRVIRTPVASDRDAPSETNQSETDPPSDVDAPEDATTSTEESEQAEAAEAAPEDDPPVTAAEVPVPSPNEGADRVDDPTPPRDEAAVERPPAQSGAAHAARIQRPASSPPPQPRKPWWQFWRK